MANALYAEAKLDLSGRKSKKELRRMGHPYGRGAGSDGKPGRQRKIKNSRARMPNLPINKQSGKLYNALKLTKQKGKLQRFIMSVNESLAPYAKWILRIGGTKKMIARRFWETVTKRWRKKNFDLLIKQREHDKRL
jgi:hypothetical protein